MRVSSFEFKDEWQGGVEAPLPFATLFRPGRNPVLPSTAMNNRSRIGPVRIGVFNSKPETRDPKLLSTRLTL